MFHNMFQNVSTIQMLGQRHASIASVSVTVGLTWSIVRSPTAFPGRVARARRPRAFSSPGRGEECVVCACRVAAYLQGGLAVQSCYHTLRELKATMASPRETGHWNGSHILSMGDFPATLPVSGVKRSKLSPTLGMLGFGRTCCLLDWTPWTERWSACWDLDLEDNSLGVSTVMGVPQKWIQMDGLYWKTPLKLGWWLGVALWLRKPPDVFMKGSSTEALGIFYTSSVLYLDGNNEEWLLNRRLKIRLP